MVREEIHVLDFVLQIQKEASGRVVDIEFEAGLENLLDQPEKLDLPLERAIAVLLIEGVLLQVAEFVKFRFEVKDHIFKSDPLFPDNLHPLSDLVPFLQDLGAQSHLIGPAWQTGVELVAHFVQILGPGNERIDRGITAGVLTGPGKAVERARHRQ